MTTSTGCSGVWSQNHTSPDATKTSKNPLNYKKKSLLMIVSLHRPHHLENKQSNSLSLIQPFLSYLLSFIPSLFFFRSSCLPSLFSFSFLLKIHPLVVEYNNQSLIHESGPLVLYFHHKNHHFEPSFESVTLSPRIQFLLCPKEFSPLSLFSLDFDHFIQSRRLSHLIVFFWNICTSDLKVIFYLLLLLFLKTWNHKDSSFFQTSLHSL